MFFKRFILVGFLIFLPLLTYAQSNQNCTPIIFPLAEKPLNNPNGKYYKYSWLSRLGENQTTYNSYRIRTYKSKQLTKKALHAARDLYTDVFDYTNSQNFTNLKSNKTVRAIAPGKVLKVDFFYAGTYQVTILHKTCDEREFIIRYGELEPSSIRVKEGQEVAQGAFLGNPGVLKVKEDDGKLRPVYVIADKVTFMLHLEYFYSTTSNQPLSFPTTHSYSPRNIIENGENRYGRRSDLEDPINILKEGYFASFKERLD